MRISRFHVCFIALWAFYIPAHCALAGECSNDAIDLGRALFFEKSLSADVTTSCGSCHDPSHAYADARPVSRGAGGRFGTRNAPSLLGIGNDDAFFWDGRRTRLEEVVLDPFTNPAEMGLASPAAIGERVRRNPRMHDGSIATLGEAVDREIYYRAFSTGHAIGLSSDERLAIVAFLNTLTDAQ